MGLTHFFQADLILLVYGIIAIALSAYTSGVYGRSAVIVLMILFFFESIMFPTIFVLGTSNLGPHTRRGAGILIMSISGGAAFPPIQGALADAHSTRISFLVPTVGFIFVAAYAAFYWIKHGLKIRRMDSTIDVPVVSTPGQKRASVIISQGTVDAIVDAQRRTSQSTDSIPQTSKVPGRRITNQTFITSEYL